MYRNRLWNILRQVIGFSEKMRPTSLNVFCEFGIWLPAITDDYSLKSAGQNLFEKFIPRLFRIATKVSEGVMNTQIQCFLP